MENFHAQLPTTLYKDEKEAHLAKSLIKKHWLVRGSDTQFVFQGGHLITLRNRAFAWQFIYSKPSREALPVTNENTTTNTLFAGEKPRVAVEVESAS